MCAVVCACGGVCVRGGVFVRWWSVRRGKQCVCAVVVCVYNVCAMVGCAARQAVCVCDGGVCGVTNSECYRVCMGWCVCATSKALTFVVSRLRRRGID